MKRGPLLIAATLLLVGAGVVAFNNRGGGAGNGDLVNWNRQPRRDYRFVVEGPLPWNFTVYLVRTDRRIDQPFEGKILEVARDFEVKGMREKEGWTVRTEPIEVTEAERRLLWFHEAHGEFGTDTTFTVRLPERTVIQLTGDPKLERRDVITLAHEESGSHGCVIRDPKLGTLQRIWNDAEGAGHYYIKRQNHLRPFRFDDLAAGSFVVAARTDGHHWIARSTTLVAGKTLDLDTAGAPEGGGTVVCENGKAVLLLGGELPIPYPRETEDPYRATWDGVPPGKHVVLYPDGRRLDVVVVDGERVVAPK